MSAIQPNNYVTGQYSNINNHKESTEFVPTLPSTVGDFTPFYVAIGICTFLLICMLILNLICCCSQYSDYWLDRHTGNRWLIIWSDSPHKQPPLDLTELTVDYNPVYAAQPSPHHQPKQSSSQSEQPLRSSREFLELHKRESEI